MIQSPREFARQLRPTHSRRGRSYRALRIALLCNHLTPHSSMGLWRAIALPRALRERPAEVERLEVRALLTITVVQNFPDINFNQNSCPGCSPPDTMVAVGPTTVLGAVNTAIV